VDMQEKAVVMGENEIGRTLVRIAHEIVEKNKGVSNLALIGIRTRGVFLAKRLAQEIFKIEKKEIPVGTLDITLYRDDLSLVARQPLVLKTEIPFDVSQKKIVLIDDVLYFFLLSHGQSLPGSSQFHFPPSPQPFPAYPLLQTSSSTYHIFKQKPPYNPFWLIRR